MFANNLIHYLHRLIDESDIGLVIPISDDLLKTLKQKDMEIGSVKELKRSIKHVLHQFILTDGGFSINLSAQTRLDAIGKFNKMKAIHQKTPTMDFTHVEIDIDTLQLDLGGATYSVEADEHCDAKEFVIGIITAFDSAIKEIVDLLSKDSLIRFYDTEEYKSLIK